MNLHIFDNQIEHQNDNSLSIGWNSSDINFLSVSPLDRLFCP